MVKIDLKKLVKSFKYAFNGLVEARNEQNLIIHFIIMICVIISGIFFKISKIEWYICIILFALVISMELINTAIETVVDLITLEKNPFAKKAKDVSASAVLVSAIASMIIGLLIFVPKILILF